MHCVSIYPSRNEDLNLKFIQNLKSRYENLPIGRQHMRVQKKFCLALLFKLLVHLFLKTHRHRFKKISIK